MIRIMHRDKRWADVEVLDGKLRVVVYDGDEASIWRLLNSPCLRHDEAGNLQICLCSGLCEKRPKVETEPMS
jgi:hypothetical protein